jgi:hypothetical protein
MTKEEAIQIVEEALEIADKYITVSQHALNVQGMTTSKVKTFLNQVCANVSTYLEIGLYKGATFISAIEGNSKLNAIGCDNWSQFKGPKDVFAQNMLHALSGASVNIYDMDCYSPQFKECLSNHDKIDVFFYDGDHTYDSQVKAVNLYKDVMPDVGILIVDDWNKWGERPTLDAIKTSGLEIVRKWELTDKNWWEGIGIMVVTKPPHN